MEPRLASAEFTGRLMNSCIWLSPAWLWRKASVAPEDTHQHQGFQLRPSSPWQGGWLQPRLQPRYWRCWSSSAVCNNRCIGKCWRPPGLLWVDSLPRSAGPLLAQHNRWQKTRLAMGWKRAEDTVNTFSLSSGLQPRACTNQEPASSHLLNVMGPSSRLWGVFLRP